MTDRELLELAAKAAGVDPIKLMTPYESKDGLSRGWVDWNPLINDGDALRLAVKLRLPVWYERNLVNVHTSKGSGFSESMTADPLAATRRAIVRAAAEIGKGMK